MRAARLVCQHLFRYADRVASPFEQDIVFCRECGRFQVVSFVYPLKVARRRKAVAVCGELGGKEIWLRGQDAQAYSRWVELVCTEPAHDGSQHYDETFGLEFLSRAEHAA